MVSYLWEPAGFVHRTPRPRRKSAKPGVNLSGQPRDNQRRKLYTAQYGFQTRPDTFPGTALPKPASVAQVQAYVDGITQSAWWATYVGQTARIEVLDGRGRGRAGSYVHQRKITIPRYQRNRWVTLHETAHQATDLIYGWDKVAPHGAEYAGVLLSLVSRFLGTVAAAALRASYAQHGVKVKALRKG